MTRAAFLVLLAGFASPAAAQGLVSVGNPPIVSIRPFIEVSQQQFSADDTFSNVFGESTAPFWGGGVQGLFWDGRLYAEGSVSRMARENNQLVGERVFVSSNEVFKLGIPLRSTIKPWKIAGGFRYQRWQRVVPYAGIGVTSYHYTEESDFANPDENLDITRRGALFQFGAEVRAHRWVGVGVGLERARVTGILGEGGLSRAYTSDELLVGGEGEDDLGGWALQLRVSVGR
jgi:hypothetical protein